MTNLRRFKKTNMRRNRPANASRRNFVKLAFCALPVFRFCAPVELYAQGASLDLPSMLRVLLDILVPKDATPSATGLGVDIKILDKLERYKFYKVLVKKGCLWFEQKSIHLYKVSFLKLKESEQIKLMQLAEKSGLRAPEYNFFRALRQDAYIFYYSNPHSWTGLVYAGPPQPHGFPDFHQKPIVQVG